MMETNESRSISKCYEAKIDDANERRKTILEKMELYRSRSEAKRERPSPSYFHFIELSSDTLARSGKLHNQVKR